MLKTFGIGTLAVVGSMLIGSTAFASTVTQYTDSSSFSSAMGVPLSVEDFTNQVHYPIAGGTLNSATNTTVANGTPITPGMILPGVTYSTPIGTGNFFNIDEGLYFTAGFLDRASGGSNNNASVALTTSFDQNVNGFGFLASPLMGTDMTVTIHFTSGPDASFSNISIPVSGTSFFGFVSNATDITSATIYGNDPTRPFAIDNFTYPTVAAPTIAAPAPSTIDDVGLALLIGAGCLQVRTRRRRSAAWH